MANSRKPGCTDTAPADALVEAVICCLRRHVRPDQHLVVGLSGGVDSVCLLHALATVGRDAIGDIELSALHVNHGISPHADRWESFCRDYCLGLDVPCQTVCVTVERASRDGLEAAARRARHGVFASLDADWLMLAHQRDDQAETLLFNLLRGAGVTGAAAMPECRGRLLRPLLGVPRRVVEQHARFHNLEWCEDESNADIRHARNFLRRKIFPELTGRFPAASRNLAGAAARFAEAKALLDELAELDLAGHGAKFPVSLQLMRTLNERRARNVLRYLLAENAVRIPSEARLREMLRQMLEAGTDRHPAVVFGAFRLRRQRGWLHLEPVAGCADKY